MQRNARFQAFWWTYEYAQTIIHCNPDDSIPTISLTGFDQSRSRGTIQHLGSKSISTSMNPHHSKSSASTFPKTKTCSLKKNIHRSTSTGASLIKHRLRGHHIQKQAIFTRRRIYRRHARDIRRLIPSRYIERRGAIHDPRSGCRNPSWQGLHAGHGIGAVVEDWPACWRLGGGESQAPEW